MRANEEKGQLIYYAVEDDIIGKHWISLEEGESRNLLNFKMNKNDYVVRDLIEVGSVVCGICDDRNLRIYPIIKFDAQQEMENMFED